MFNLKVGHNHYGSYFLSLSCLLLFYTFHFLLFTCVYMFYGVLCCSQLSQFLRMMHELGVIRVQETMKGVESITNIDFDHPSINNISSPAYSSASAVGTTKLVS